jgi:hypothetical protein
MPHPGRERIETRFASLMAPTPPQAPASWGRKFVERFFCYPLYVGRWIKRYKYYARSKDWKVVAKAAARWSGKAPKI